MITTERTLEQITADWPSYYGLSLSDIGEDGDVVVIGHHDPLRVVAALNRHARTAWGNTRLLEGDYSLNYRAAADALTQRWARFITDCDEPTDHARGLAEDGACSRCQELADADWWISWGSTVSPVLPGTPGVFPITHWSA